MTCLLTHTSKVTRRLELILTRNRNEQEKKRKRRLERKVTENKGAVITLSTGNVLLLYFNNGQASARALGGV